jgi:lipid-A-disaccharide synthase
MIVVGEASGDLHGAKLAQALQALDGRLSLFGIGGDRMREAGVKVVMNSRQLAVVGITEIAAQMPNILRGWRTACRMLADDRPDLLILIDFPDFNLRLARYAKRLQIKVLYYISPQIWAWRRQRVKQIRRRVDHMAVILPFEADFYRRHGVPVSFVGHPLMDQDPPSASRHTPPPPSVPPTVGLLPGSRDSEVRRLLPPMLGAARRLQCRLQARLMLSQADSVNPQLVARTLALYRGQLRLDIVQGDPARIFTSADLVIAASGTVTLQAAMHATPMIIVYRVSPVSYWLGKALIQVPHIGLVNLIAGRGIVPELVQQNATPASIAAEARSLLTQPLQLARMRADLAQIRDRLGTAGASLRVAQIALALLARSTPAPPTRHYSGTHGRCP